MEYSIEFIDVFNGEIISLNDLSATFILFTVSDKIISFTFISLASDTLSIFL